MSSAEIYPSALLSLPSLSAQPLYNIKAIGKRTGIPAATLRAWERRYAIPQPNRSAQGYRLYSERDVALLLWLRQQVEGGLSIARAARQLQLLLKSDQAKPRPPFGLASQLPLFIHSIRSPSVLRRELATALRQNDSTSTDQLLTEALALFTLETTLVTILHGAVQDVIANHAGSGLTIKETVALNHVQQRLLNLMQTVALPLDGRPALLTVGFSSERTAIERTIIELLLRRKGIAAQPLGADLDLAWLKNGLVLPAAQLVVFYIDDPVNAARLINLTMPMPAVWCGQAASLASDLTTAITFEYLGADLREIVQNIIVHIQVADHRTAPVNQAYQSADIGVANGPV